MEFAKDSIAGAVGRHFILADPGAVVVAKEIILRADQRVEGGAIDS
jgi:hypothetical protein